jgi:CBS domain-containing protein
MTVGPRPGTLMNQDLRVEHAMESVKYRVYPETPFEEVVDLMVRREIHAVPVVGEGYEVLGIITAGDALAQVLREEPGGVARWEPRGPSLTARDVMSRSILCVSEDELLSEAAQTMVNRHVEQLPVVRDSELVGFLTREGLLRALHADGAWKSEEGA